MNHRSRFWINFCACLAGATLSACNLFPDVDELTDIAPQENGKSKVTVDAIRAKDPQAKIGAQSHPKVFKANGGAYQNEQLENLLTLVTGRLVAETSNPNRAFDITVLNTPSVNAFALPGGYLYVTRGLLALANDASEIAAVLAHEMAHISSNHGVQRSRQAQAISIADRVADQVVTNPVVAQVVKATGEDKLSAFSQKQELQADAIGIKMLGGAGYDAFAASRFLRSMDRYSAWRTASNNANDVDMSSSHPSTPRRIELAKRHARIIGAPGTGDRGRKRYLEGVDGIMFGDTRKNGFVRESRFSHPKLRITFQVPEAFELSNREEAVIASGPNQMALRFDAVSQKGFERKPVKYLKSGWLNGLDVATVRRIKSNGLSGARGFASTGDWHFVVSVFDTGNRFYRFITAAPRDTAQLDTIADQISNSFRKMSAKEVTDIKTLHVRVVTVKDTDTLAKLASRMQGVSRKLELFRALNGLESGQRPKEGSQVKIVSE